MPKKKDICPRCRIVYLKWSNKKKKLMCPKCGFEDRRHGNSMVDPMIDRRGSTASVWDALSKWEHRK
jgi:Zn-finger nucleic acid-binding protein